MPATTGRLRAVRCSVRAGCLGVIWVVTVVLLRPAGPLALPACLLPAHPASGADDIMRKKTDVVPKRRVRQNQAMTARRHRVVCVLADGMTAIGPAIANDLFGAPWDLGVPWYSYRVCTADPVPIRVGPLRVQVEHGVSALSRADTVIIPGRGLRPPTAELLAALTRAYQRGARMVSFCTGAYGRAEAGPRDGAP